MLSSGNPNDYFADQQTGSKEADIVGTLQSPGFYTAFDDDGSLTAGTIYYRVRVASDLPTSGQFNSALFVGFDANADGILDIFLGVDNRGSSNQIKIWNAGTGANVSPSTTSVASPANQKVYNETASNYSFTAVNSIIDPAASSFDIDNDGHTDFFISFSVPFADVVNETARLTGITIDKNSPLRYVVVTSQQDNSFNQDLGGVQGGVGSTSTWTQLGAISAVLAPVTTTAAPDPGPALTLVTGLAALVALRLRRPLRRS
jgi:hypothetical protein